MPVHGKYSVLITGISCTQLRRVQRILNMKYMLQRKSTKEYLENVCPIQ